MMRSLSSAVSGLKAHQTAMDVIGNNIANVNTVGFKYSRATFQEVFAETLKGAGSPQSDGRGGTNPEQVGLGITVGTVDTIMTRGAVNRTDNPTDLCISGNGFFMASEDAKGTNKHYTRAGNFTLDKSGNLVTASGMHVLGYMADPTDSTGQKMKGTLEGITIPMAQTVDPKATDSVVFEGNLDSSTAVSNAASKAGVRETTFRVYDSLGNTHDIKLTLQHKGAANTWEATYSVASGTGSVSATTTLTFDATGKLPAAGVTTAVSLSGIAPAADPLNFTVDLSKLTSVAGDSSASATEVTGYAQGTLDNFNIAPTGEIRGVFSNGQARTLGRIALANFKNPAGLEKIGENMYDTSNNSGEALIGVPGNGGFGQINAGALEMSNVDLAKEFTSMITTQRGFQANSKIITTSDEMLQDLVNLKR